MAASTRQPHLVETMRRCLCRNPAERATIRELLAHPGEIPRVFEVTLQSEHVRLVDRLLEGRQIEAHDAPEPSRRSRPLCSLTASSLPIPSVSDHSAERTAS